MIYDGRTAERKIFVHDACLQNLFSSFSVFFHQSGMACISSLINLFPPSPYSNGMYLAFLAFGILVEKKA